MMSTIFSQHAKDQIKRRGISQKKVLQIISSPTDIISSFRNRKLRRGIVGDKLLEVVTRTEGSKITVITAYYLENSYENEI